MSRPVATIVIVVSVSLVVGVGMLDLAGYITTSVLTPVLGPKIVMEGIPQFTVSSCQPEYWWIIQTGEHETVTATFTLNNSGYSDGHATVTFTSDGAQVTQHDFYVGRGQMQQLSYQFQVKGCDTHDYWAYVSGESGG